jgi:hypothetical protein
MDREEKEKEKKEEAEAPLVRRGTRVLSHHAPGGQR